jgi:hypothetical protein
MYIDIYIMSFKNFKSGNYIPRGNKCAKTKIAKYRSSWELMFCNLLDDSDIVIAWEFEQVFIPYYYGQKNRKYIMDFKITLANGKQYLIEIKPATFYRKAIEKRDMNFFKWEAAKVYAEKHGYVFKVLTEITLPRLASAWRSYNRIAQKTNDF